MPAIPPAPAPASDLARLQARWGDLARAALTDGQIDLGTILAGSRLTAIEGGRAVLACDRPVPPALLPALRAALTPLGLAGEEPRLEVVAASGGRDARSPVTAAQADPLVRELVRRFDASIFSGDPMTREEWLARLERLA